MFHNRIPSFGANMSLASAKIRTWKRSLSNMSVSSPVMSLLFPSHGILVVLGFSSNTKVQNLSTGQSDSTFLEKDSNLGLKKKFVLESNSVSAARPED